MFKLKYREGEIFHIEVQWWAPWWDWGMNRWDENGKMCRHTHTEKDIYQIWIRLKCPFLGDTRLSTADLLDILIRGNISHSNDLHHSFPLLNHSVSLSLSVMRRSPQCHWWWLSGSLSTSLINLGNREESASLTTLGSHARAHAQRPVGSHRRYCLAIRWGIELSLISNSKGSKQIWRIAVDTPALPKKPIKVRLAQRCMNSQAHTGNYKEHIYWKTHTHTQTQLSKGSRQTAGNVTHAHSTGNPIKRRTQRGRTRRQVVVC